jgi:hypothetical protein
LSIDTTASKVVGTITEYPLPGQLNEPYFIATGADKALWFTEVGSDTIGGIAKTGSITNYSIPTTNSYPQGIAAGPDGGNAGTRRRHQWISLFLNFGRAGHRGRRDFALLTRLPKKTKLFSTVS